MGFIDLPFKQGILRQPDTTIFAPSNVVRFKYVAFAILKPCSSSTLHLNMTDSRVCSFSKYPLQEGKGKGKGKVSLVGVDGDIISLKRFDEP